MEEKDSKLKVPPKIDILSLITRTLLSESFVIFFIPIIIIFSVYLYYKGVFLFYSIPPQFIFLEPFHYYGLAVSFIFPLIFNLSFVLVEIIGKDFFRENKFVKTFYIFIIIFVIIIFIFSQSINRNFLIPFLFFGVWLFGLFIIFRIILLILNFSKRIKRINNLFTFLDKKVLGWIQKKYYLAELEKIRQNHKNEDTVTRNIYLYFSVIFISLLCLIVGYINAKNELEYLVPMIKPDCVIVHNTSEKAICKNYDPQTGKLLNGFRIINLGNDPNLLFESKSIGPLKN